MSSRLQFRLSAMFVLAFAVALGAVVSTSIPRRGKPTLAVCITDVQGGPIANATVRLYSGVATRFAGQSSTTDRFGRCRFAPLDTGSILVSESGGFHNALVGITVDLPGFHAEDGLKWWDISVPQIQNRVHSWNLIMIPDPADPGDLTVKDRTE